MHSLIEEEKRNRQGIISDYVYEYEEEYKEAYYNMYYIEKKKRELCYQIKKFKRIYLDLIEKEFGLSIEKLYNLFSKKNKLCYDVVVEIMTYLLGENSKKITYLFTIDINISNYEELRNKYCEASEEKGMYCHIFNYTTPLQVKKSIVEVVTVGKKEYLVCVSKDLPDKYFTSENMPEEIDGYFRLSQCCKVGFIFVNVSKKNKHNIPEKDEIIVNLPMIKYFSDNNNNVIEDFAKIWKNSETEEFEF